MTILLHLVRHGQTSWNVDRRIQGHTESRLNELGRSQATAIGRRLRSYLHPRAFIAVYCSTSIRTRETLELLLEGTPYPVSYQEALKEMCFGEWEEQLWDDIERRHPEMVMRFRESSPEFSVPGAENHKQLQTRGVAAIEAILASHEQPGGDILIVSHGAILKQILAAYTGIDLAVRPDLPPLPNCSHSIIEAVGSHRQVVTIAGDPIESTVWANAIATPALSALQDI